MNNSDNLDNYNCFKDYNFKDDLLGTRKFKNKQEYSRISKF